MIITLIGQDIPALLPSLLTDLYHTVRATCDLRIEEKNPAMQDVLERYAQTVHAQSGMGGSIVIDRDRRQLLTGADCVIYAGDCMAASRFHQDYEALRGPEDDPENPGLTDQARVNGGIEGLLHTLRQGEMVLTLCEDMQACCPNALVITLGQPVARTVELFEMSGFVCYGLAASPLRGVLGLTQICQQLKVERKQVSSISAGLPGFSWYLSLKSDAQDLLPALHDQVSAGVFGRLPERWLQMYGCAPAGDAILHAELMPSQPDFIPEENPPFGESVEQRKKRILNMNTVAEKGLAALPSGEGLGEGTMAQWLLLSEAPPQRPMLLALSLLLKQPLHMPGVSRRNRGEIANLPAAAIIESDLTLDAAGSIVPHGHRLPEALRDLCLDIDEAARLSAHAAAGDRTALRECIEIDPAMDGLDRLYVQDVVENMIRMHDDVIYRLSDEDEEF